jgi:hypothetical protein
MEEEFGPRMRELKSQGDGMKVPSGYFEQLDDAVFARLDASGERRMPPPEAVSGWRTWLNPRTLTAAAASVALVAGALWWLRPIQPDAPLATTEVLELSPDMARAYVEENIMEFDEDLLAAHIEKVIDDLAPSTPSSPKSKTPPPPKDELDEILDELTDEELEDLL